jgi:IS1 family transposase
VKQVLSTCGRQINTAFVERLNLDIRQRVAAVGRRGCFLPGVYGGSRTRWLRIMF